VILQRKCEGDIVRGWNYTVPAQVTGVVGGDKRRRVSGCWE
jgi:predicted oxidoreductase